MKGGSLRFERWARHLFSRAGKSSGWGAIAKVTLEKSHIEATMRSLEGYFTATLRYSVLFSSWWSHNDCTSNLEAPSQNQYVIKALHCLKALSSTNHPSLHNWLSRQTSHEWYSLRSDHPPWLFSVEWLCDTLKGRLPPSQGKVGPAIQIERDAPFNF